MVAYKPNNENNLRSPLGHLESDVEMEKIYGNDDVSLSDVADDFLDGLDEDFDMDREPSPKFRKVLYAVLVVSVLGGFSTLAYYAYQFGRKPMDTTQLQVVKADTTPYKEKPLDPGGMEVPNRDKTVYDSIAGSQSKALPKVERILPPPEEPVKPSQVVYESVTDGNTKSREVTVTNSREALLANKALGNNEIKPVVIKAEDKEEAPATTKVALSMKPISEEDLKAAPKTSKFSEQPAVVPTASSAEARYRVQLGAYRSDADAAKEWTRLTKVYPGELKGLKYFVERKDLGEKGIFYRLQAGPFENSSDARQACKKLIENKQGCFFVEVQ